MTQREYISIGSTPAEESCECVGPNCDYDKMRAECRRFIDAIRVTLGPEPDGAQLRVKGFPHDFGTYYEVVCYYEEENETAVDYAFRCESDAPLTWPAVQS